MTMNKVFAKLQKGGKVNYAQIKSCFTFAMVLISTFISIVMNSAVKDVLPQGGDSIKQVYMIFGIALIGCLVFTVYAGGLFLRYKSKEIGVFLALGAQKKQLSKSLYNDLLGIIINGICLGIIIGTFFAFLILKFFQLTLSVGIERVSLLSLSGITVSLLFGCIVGACILILAARFMRRTNIIDIMNEERKNENLKKDIDQKYLVRGIGSLILGLVIIGVLIPVFTRVTGRVLGAWTNVFFLLVILGIYRIMVYSISVHKRGNNPQIYYKNIIPYGMLKFQGSSIVKNMLVVTLLIICSLFACLYTPTKYIVEQNMIRQSPVDFSMSYLHDTDNLKQEDIFQLAKKNGVEIIEYHEIEFIRLLGSGVNRDNIDDKGNVIQEYEKQRFYYCFMSVSQYNEITGEQISIDNGHYRLLVDSNMYENMYNKFDDLDYVENPYTNQSMDLEYDGNAEGNGLVDKDGFQSLSRYVINDQDYKALGQGLPEDRQLSNVIFNVQDIDASYPFALELYKSFCDNASPNMMHLTYYDEHQEEVNIGIDGYYGYGDSITVNAGHPEEYPDWKYVPNFKILEMKNGFLSFAVFYLLFIVVTIICFAAVGVISYTRSITIAVSNKETFNDIRKLGANEDYLKRVLRKLIKNVYVLPTLIGCLAMLIWYPLTLWQNDGHLTTGEMQIVMIEILLCVGVGLYQCILYKASIKNTGKIVLK